MLTSIEYIQARHDYGTLPRITLYVFSTTVRQQLFELGSMFGKIYIPARSAMVHLEQWSQPGMAACRELLGAPTPEPVVKAVEATEAKERRKARERSGAPYALKTITIATDGSVCGGRGGGGSYGWIDENGAYGMGPVSTLDILVAEITAITVALHSAPLTHRVRIHTDSKPAIAHIKASAKELSGAGRTRNVTKALRKLHERIEKHAAVEFVWVRAHNGNILNDGADRLARMARQTVSGVSEDARAEIAQNIAADVVNALAAKGRKTNS